MRLQRLIEQVNFKPWHITPAGHASVRMLLESKLGTAYGVKAEDSGMDLDEFVNPRRPMFIDGAGIAHIHVCGVLGKGLSSIVKSCGNTSYDDLEKELNDVIENGCAGVWFEFDSPGGSVTGCGEIADLIFNLPVPSVAWTDDEMHSAAYMLGVNCDKIMASSSASVGSIGTLVPWVDTSRAWSAAGMEFQPITNTEGDLKAAGHGPSLTPAQRDSMQAYVQTAFNTFRSVVLRNRAVAPETMRGQCFFAMPDGLQANLIDEVTTENQAYAQLLQMVNS